MRDLLTIFGEAFDECHTYTAAQPNDQYLKDLLDGDTFIALACEHEGRIIGGLAAYELKKFEQARSEIYIYDLAVTGAHLRKGIATSLIQELQILATKRNAYVIFVQADYVDPPAIALYTKLGTREEVLHFDIPVK